MKKIVNLTNCTAILEYQHKNFKNGRLTMMVDYDGDYLEPTYIPNSVLIETEAEKKIAKILEKEYIINFTSDDCKVICDEGRKLTQSPENVEEKMGIRKAVREIYIYHIEHCKKYHLNSLQGQPELTYIRTRKANGVDYLCINYKACQYILNSIWSGLQREDFKSKAIMAFDLWAGKDQSHKGLYHNVRRANEDWSIRIPLSQIDIKRAEAEMELRNTEDSEEVA